METVDYVVIGGGSAGCAAAGRLAEAGHRVLVLEVGDRAEDHPETLTSDGYKTAFMNDRTMWERFSVPQPQCRDQTLYMGSGRGAGGSGSVNGMVYLRGSRFDWDSFEVDGWRWDDVTGDFESLERRLEPTRQEPTPFAEACVEAACATGFERKADFNDGDLCGFLGYEWMNMRDGLRRSSYVAFLQQSDVALRTGARVRRIRFDAAGRAVGVEYLHDGQERFASARREVLLTAGALESPRLLMLSGIGPADELRRHGIDVVADTPGVGQNFHDHPNVTCFFKGTRETDFAYPQLYGFHRMGPAEHLPEGAADTCFVFYTARSSLREATIRLLPAMLLPLPVYRMGPVARTVRGAIRAAFAVPPVRSLVKRVYGVVVILGKPLSRGAITLDSADPDAPARIDPGYLSDPRDLETMVRGVEQARRMVAAPTLRAWGNAELRPGRRAASRAAVEAFIRKNIMTTYHYAGTCRMGQDAASVVDPALRVRGVTGLRVMDASVIPTTPVSAMNAPSMLVGYRGAGMILQAQG